MSPYHPNVTESFQAARNRTGVALITYALQHPDNDTAVGMAKKYCSIGCTPACPESWQSIFYLPNYGANSVYMIIFLLVLAAQIWLGIRHRTWSFLGAMVPGLFGEMIGYMGRLLLHHNPYIENYFLTYLICLTIAPAFLTAAIYLCLSRIVAVTGAQHSRLAPRSYTYIFIGCDIFALFLQGAGGGLAATAKTHSGSQTGAHVMVAGLAWQVVSMTLFLGLWADFALRVKRAKVSAGWKKDQRDPFAVLRDSRKFRTFKICLAVSTVLIFIRSIYRVVELQGGFSGKIANNQASFMILEGPMILIAVISLTFYHPGRIFGGLWVSTGRANGAVILDDDQEELAQRGGKGGFQAEESPTTWEGEGNGRRNAI